MLDDYVIVPIVNKRAAFITQGPGNCGSSLYIVTEYWVIRCSGNNTGGRSSETFIRKRKITYIGDGGTFTEPKVGAFPREGGHDGNGIVAILDVDNLSGDNAPHQWKEANGVSWKKAYDECQDALKHVIATFTLRASREVGQNAFHAD